MTELAKRAVACPGWRWMPGMLPLVVDEDGDSVACDRVWRTQGGHTVVPAGATPDLEDPATLGCLLALVRLARLDPAWLPTCLDGEALGAWVIDPPSRKRQTRHESYAAVLVAALEAAP